MMRFALTVAPSLFVAETALAAPEATMGNVSSVIASLALVVGVILAAAWVVRRTPFGIGRGNGPLKVLAALSLGPKERLLLVDAGGEQVLLAVSPAGVFNVGAPQAGAARAPLVTPTFSLPDPS